MIFSFLCCEGCQTGIIDNAIQCKLVILALEIMFDLYIFSQKMGSQSLRLLL